MSLDLYQQETSDRMLSLRPVMVPEPDVFDGFLRGTGMHAMRSLAKAGSAIDLLGSVGPIIQDTFTGGTEAQDRYFKEHDEVFGNAIDHWTPKPGEVGAAGEVAGTLLATLPLVMASPALTVAQAQLSTAEDLVKKGVDADKAQAVGAVQAAGLGLGIYMPIFGRSLWQRMLLGGAGFNVIQGAAMRGASDVVLQGTPAEGEFKAFDTKALTLDLLLGLAFGAITHISPTQRVEGARYWERMKAWGNNLKPSDVDAIATLRQAQHANVDTLPGKPVEASDLQSHVERIRTATEQLLRGEPVDVSTIPAGKYEAVPDRFVEAAKRADTLVSEAAAVAKAYDIVPERPKAVAAEFEGAGKANVPDGLRSWVEEYKNARSAGNVKLAKEIKANIDTEIKRHKLDAQNVYGADPDARPFYERVATREGEKSDPLSLEAQRFADENPDVKVSVGRDANGEPITKTAREYMDEARADSARLRKDASLFEIAAACLMGVM